MDFRSIFEKRQLMFRHHWLNLSIQSPRLVFPVLVALIVSPQANAAFTAAFLVVGIVQTIPNLLSTVLFASPPGMKRPFAAKCERRCGSRWSFRSLPHRSSLSSPFILKLFGPNYAVASTAMGFLGLSTYPYAIKSHYVSIARVQGRMHQAVIWTMGGAFLEAGFAAAGGALHGLTGVAVGIFLAFVLEGIVYSPTVFRVLRHPLRRNPQSPYRGRQKLQDQPRLDENLKENGLWSSRSRLGPTSLTQRDMPRRTCAAANSLSATVRSTDRRAGPTSDRRPRPRRRTGAELARHPPIVLGGT